MKIKHRKLQKTNIIVELVLILTVMVWLVPIITALETSLSAKGIENYRIVLTTRVDGFLVFPRMFLNSLWITAWAIFLVMTCAVLGAYAFSKMRFRGRQALYLALLGCYAIPMVSTLIPNSIFITNMGLRGTYASMIVLLVTVNLPLALMIFKSSFDSLPDAFLEAATIDGSNSFITLVRIVVPMSTPILVNVLVVSFIQIWNDFQIPLIFATTPKLYPLTMAPKFFGLSSNKLDLPPLYASIIIIAVPVIIFYMLMQDKIIKGMSLGGVKE